MWTRRAFPAILAGTAAGSISVARASTTPSAPGARQFAYGIDPGHVVGEDGKRYLFVNGGRRVRLKDDGLVTDGPMVSGLHHNVFSGFVSLRPALFSAGAGEVRIRNFVYRGLPA